MAVNHEQLKFIMLRFDTYIGGANTKGAFLLAFNTFICGGLFSNYSTLKGLVKPCLAIYIQVGILVIVLAGIASLIIVLLAVYPFLKSGHSVKDKYHSLIYFGAVSGFETPDKYIEALKKEETNDVFNDLAKQVYQLALGLKKKYKQLEWATKIIFFQLAVVIVTIAVIIINDI